MSTPHNCDEMTLDNHPFVQVRKRPVVVHASQMKYPGGFSVTTPEGVMTGRQFDYLMVGTPR